MIDQLYVATDVHGVQHAGGADVAWQLPSPSGPGANVTADAGGTLHLYGAAALLDVLDERIFVAAPTAAGPEAASPVAPAGGVVEVPAARIERATGWDIATAARFALDCAEHVLGDAAAAVLPGGATLGEVVADARTVLERSEEGAERRLGLLARLAAARRLRRRGDVLGDVALKTMVEDSAEALEMLEDPAWAAVATARDAVLGAVEAVRYLALPRYVAAREESFDESRQGGTDTPSAVGSMLMTPWGPITLGAEHHRAFEPAWVAARDAAQRARDTARGNRGHAAAEAERIWQAAHLVELLERP